MIAYCKADAQAAFTELADILEKTAATNFGDNQPIGNADLLDEIRRIVEANPIADPIRTAFEKARDIAARAGDAETERELHTRHTDLIADFNTIDSADDQEGAGETYQRHLRSHAAWILAVSASIDDSGKRTDKQSADGDAIARKVADAVRNELKDIQDDVSDTLGEAHRARVVEFEKRISINGQLLAKLGDIQCDTHGAKVAAERAANGVEELAAEMTAWREWVRELAKHPNAKPSEPKLCATVQGKICEIWQGFKNAPADCELPNGKFRKTKRTFAECLALHGHDEVWHGKRLIDFIPDEDAFERVVHNGAEKARQAKAKTKAKPPKSQKRKTQARRKK